MNVAEYTKALSKLPMMFKVLPFYSVSVCEYRGRLFMTDTSGRTGAIYFENGDWHELETEQVA